MNLSVIGSSMTTLRHLLKIPVELILFYESGYVPSKGQETLMFPILKKDDVEDESLFRR